MQTRAQTKKNAFKQSIVAQTAVVEQTTVVEICAICCDALHQDALHQDALHQDALHQDALHQDALHQDALHQDALHQDALHQKIKTLHSGPNWKHCFHNNCIDGWYLACIEKQKTPCCPLCPLTPFPDDYVPSSPIYNKHHALKMFKAIKMYRVIAPYIGIMVCMNGKCLFKLTNLNLCYFQDEWEYNSSDHHELTLWHIKDKILGMNKLIYNKYGNPNETWSDTLSYLFYSKYPKLEIINTSYTIPPKCVSFGEMDMSTIDDDSTLRDIYVDYHTQLEEMKKNPSTDPITLEHINNISTEKTRWIENRNYITGYLNPENPNVIRSIYFPWAWVAIHLDYKY